MPRLRLRDEVPAGHKVALREIPRGEQVRKYGQVIGVATSDIAAGEHVHTHNLAFAEFERDYAFGIDAKGPQAAPPGPPATFSGIVRPDGQRRHPELPGRSDLGQLLGHGGADDR